MRARTLLIAGLFGALIPRSLWAQTGRAPTDDQCVNAYESGQEQRLDRKLKSASAAVKVCASASCPETVVGQCASWLEEVERELPSVVIAVRDASGRDRTDARIALDREVIDRKRLGVALEVDPGPHVLSVTSADGKIIDQ